jgi:hypothetical protein
MKKLLAIGILIILTNCLREVKSMSDLNRGIMKFEGADKPIIVTVSAVVILGSIGGLIIWALKVAYTVG